MVPVQSFEPDLTGIGIPITTGGLFEPLRHLRYKDHPRAFIATVLNLLREHAPTVYERLDTARFELSRPLDLAYAAITPTVRRGFVPLSNGRTIIALGDAHVVIDPITGQGANSASHAAQVLSEAIGNAKTFDRAFCQRVEQEMCSYVVPVSDASNARFQPPTAHGRQLLGAATRDQTIANVYAEGYNHPDRFWAIASSPERTAAFLSEFETSAKLVRRRELVATRRSCACGSSGAGGVTAWERGREEGAQGAAGVDVDARGRT